ncbi:expressed conserved protein [Echinococcus multilocularis]|uniref:Expressed conserved protein n=1 Tax=Echinococcus multilocularis TaxID=6211 RepID=A0A068YGM6_ECHMU|nr:expressed conserved protein [Echinococcus multilocularis]
MVDRHFNSGDDWYRGGYRSTGGTRLREAPQLSGPRNYFGDSDSYYGYSSVGQPYSTSNGNVAYYDSADWYRPRNPTYSAGYNSGVKGSFYTGDMPYGNYPSQPPHIRWYNQGQPVERPGSGGETKKFQPFACQPLDALPNSSMESTVTDLGNANKCFDQVTFKIFNKTVIPGYILHGIVYFDVKEDARINKITLNGQCNVRKEISGRHGSDTEAQVNSFKKEIVAPTGGKNKRQPGQYEAITEVWDGDDLMESLQLPDDYFNEDCLEWPFGGPITLPKGTHAIPFAVRIPAEVNPTITYTRKGEHRHKAVVTHSTSVSVQVDAQPASGGALLTALSDKVPLQVISCGGLPPVVNGMYAPGCVQLVELGYKNASALIILEKKHMLPKDTIRITIYTDNKNALHGAYAELIASTNLPEIGLSDSSDVIMEKKAPGIELLDRCSKQRMKYKFNRAFVSKVGNTFPAGDTNNTPSGRLRPSMDDKRLMPEASRQAVCMLELKVPEDTESSIEAGEYRIRHHVRVHLDVRRQRKPVSQAQLITVANQLRHNYTVKYIKFLN